MDLLPAPFFAHQHRPGLFRSRAWLEAWYEIWGHHPDITLLGINQEIKDTDLSLVVSRSRQLKKKLLPITSASPLGVSTQVTPSLRSEYFFFSNNSLSLSRTVENYLDQILDYSWDQFYIPDLLCSSEDYRLLLEHARARNLYIIHSKVENTYAIDTSNHDFHHYLKSLGKATRLKLFNRRKNFAQLGEIAIVNLHNERSKFYQLLNSFHQARWGKDCYSELNLEFINRLLDKLEAQGAYVDMSALSVNGEVVSSALDIHFNGRQYNLQSGYTENFHKQISLGTLHLGYQIEKAFANPDIDFYDFMAGTGKHADYKKSLVNRQDRFASLLLVRSPWLKKIYQLQAAIKKHLR